MSRSRETNADLVTVTDAMTCLARLAVDLDALGLVNPLNDGSAAVGKHGRQILIETEPFDFILGGELDDLRAGRKRGRRGVHGRLGYERATDGTRAKHGNERV